MRVNGVWVGWGVGDHSAIDDTVRRAKAYMRAMYRSYAGHLADTNEFDREMEAAVIEMQQRLVLQGRLELGTYVTGVLDLPTQIAMGFKKAPNPVRPIIITVEGHLSSMYVGPCAYVASKLESEGVCWWQPIGYDNTSLPFRNQTGISAVLDVLRQTVLLDGNGQPTRPFPLGTPWGIEGFSQGAIIANRILMLLRDTTDPMLQQRYADLTRGLTFGDPYREKDVVAEWVTDPPKPGTQGISDVRLTNTPSWWKVVSRRGDLYSENPDNEVGLNRSAIYKIAAENSWAGGPAGLLQRIGDFLMDPLDGTIDIGLAIIGGVMFMGNMEPHGGYDLNPCVEYMRGVGTRRVA
ncbi:lysin B [Mycobacterium phage Papyrus]|uniref:Lysin B n=1 Tax=Mycobacterium phage Papyrus TaxID=1383056 RepID=S5Y1K9_9CAUD|nr:lysin B [Mycobacterium phage Papyrus]AGT14049.1 lysin B [Mycobacterium phage Papyrus]